MTDKQKNELFEKMLELEHLGEINTSNGINYFVTMSDGMFEAFKILGIESEYIKWSYGK